MLITTSAVTGLDSSTIELFALALHTAGVILSQSRDPIQKQEGLLFRSRSDSVRQLVFHVSYLAIFNCINWKREPLSLAAFFLSKNVFANLP